MQATAQQIAWGAIGRRAIELDPRWRGGDYYDAEPGDGPDDGLAVARMVAQVTFRSDNVFTERFGRDLVGDQFEVERYLEYHGAKLGRRFDTNSYVVIGKAMDLHDVARNRGSVAGGDGPHRGRRRWSSASRRTCCTRTTSSARSTRCCARRACASRYVEIDSPHGHDAFLINLDQVGEPIAEFLDQAA